MSLSYSGQSVIGGKFDTGVETQLNLRKEIINKVNTSTTDDIKYLTSTTGWVRAISSVDTFDSTQRTFTSDPSRTSILQGGTPDSFNGFNPSQNKSSYTLQQEYGYIPTAGITSFQVMAKGTFGTLRTASFTFTVHSPEDFSKLEQLYLRPGFSILLEWGHSYHLSNTERKLIPTTDIYPQEDFLRPSSDTVIESKIDSLKSTGNSYNYDALFGIIKNFIWNYNGYSYECQVDVVSKGEVVEAVRAVMAPLTRIKESVESTNVKYDPTEYGSELIGYLKLIESVQIEPKSTNISRSILEKLKEQKQSETLTNRIEAKHQEVNKPITFVEGNLTQNYQSKYGNTRYISLRTLLILINETALLYFNNDPYVSFNVGENNTVNSYTTFNNHFALDLGICILPKPQQAIIAFQPGISLPDILGSNDILDIFISVSFLTNQLEELQKKSDIESKVYDLIADKVLGPIQDNLGNINYFDIAEDRRGGKTFLHIVDRKVIPSKNDIKTKLDLVGLASEVSNLNITSKISNNLTSMIAIAAQTTYSPSSAEDLYNMQKWNVGLRDRHLKKGTIGRNAISQENIDITTEVSQDLKLQLNNYTSRVNSETKNPELIIPSPEGLYLIHRQVMNERVRANTNTPPATNPPGLIPFELSFTLKGISGIKVGQAFTVNDFFLPERYKGRVGFIVTGIDHKVNDNIWTTDIKSQMIFI